MSYLKNLLREKLPQSAEIELHLFEFCNLNCSFCGQDHDSTVGMDLTAMEQKAERVVDFMLSSGQTSFIVNIMGGEIFNDEVPDQVIDRYRTLHRIIYQASQVAGYEIRFNWVTNLIFTKRYRALEFIQNHEASYISTSYDFAGRGLDLNRKLCFEKNLELFSDYITVVGFVLTRPAIRKLLADKDPYFKKLYTRYPLYFDYYVPERSAAKMMPSEQEMLDAYRFIAEHYPNVYPVKDWLENEHNEMTCYSVEKLTLLPDNREVTCRYMDYEEGEFESPVNYQSNENIIEAHLNRHDCLSCPYYRRCQFRCFVQADWAGLERLETCLMRTFFDEHPLD